MGQYRWLVVGFEFRNHQEHRVPQHHPSVLAWRQAWDTSPAPQAGRVWLRRMRQHLSPLPLFVLIRQRARNTSMLEKPFLAGEEVELG